MEKNEDDFTFTVNVPDFEWKHDILGARDHCTKIKGAYWIRSGSDDRWDIDWVYFIDTTLMLNIYIVKVYYLILKE